MKQTIYGIILLALLSPFGSKAQDVHFSQINETPLLISPANTGFYNGYFRAIANYRNQWASMNKAFQTMCISLDGGVFRAKKRPAFMGLGVLVFNDRAGVANLSRTDAILNVSGVVKASRKSIISAGIGLGTASYNADYTKLTYESQFNGNYLDPTRVSGENAYRQYTHMELSAGLAYEFATVKRDPDHDDVMSFKIAFGAYHLNRPVQDYAAGSSYRLPVRWTGAITSVLDIEDTRFTVTPTFVYSRQGTNQEFLMGTYIKYRMSTGTKVTGAKTQNAIGFGLFYRRNDAIIPQLICDFGDYTVAMSYDANVSSYTAASRGFGGFEIALRYNNLASSLFDTRREYK